MISQGIVKWEMSRADLWLSPCFKFQVKESQVTNWRTSTYLCLWTWCDQKQDPCFQMEFSLSQRSTETLYCFHLSDHTNHFQSGSNLRTVTLWLKYLGVRSSLSAAKCFNIQMISNLHGTKRPQLYHFFAIPYLRFKTFERNIFILMYTTCFSSQAARVSHSDDRVPNCW